MPNAIRRPSPVFCNANPKNSAGINVHIADCVNPANTIFGCKPSISANIARNSPPIAYESPNGLKIHMHNVIIVMPNIKCAVLSSSAENGRIITTTSAASSIIMLPM